VGVSTKECQYCLSELSSEARKCKFCGEWLVQPEHQNGASSTQNDERVRCSNCHKLMVPRLIMGPPSVHGGSGYWTPVPRKSICPYCAETFKVFSKSQKEIKAVQGFKKLLVAIAAIIFFVAAIMLILFLVSLPAMIDSYNMGKFK